jgi:hypothetical protein
MPDPAPRLVARPRPPVSPAVQKASIVLVTIPALVLVAHVAIGLWAEQLISPYYHSRGMHVTAGLVSIDFVIAFILYRKNPTHTLFAARLLCILSLLSLALLLGSQLQLPVE